MSKFEVPVKRVDSVEDHPNADRLSIVKIGGYNCISAKLEDGRHRYAKGDLVVYVPEDSVLPDWLLMKMGFWNEAECKGILSGKEGNRVKAVKLRGIVSQGVLYPVVPDYEGKFTNPLPGFLCVEPNKPYVYIKEGDDVAEHLGITKYEVPIPVQMQGEVWNARGLTLSYDIESIQKNPDAFEAGETVVVTEKLHGTWACFGINEDDHIVTSKGLSNQGLAFKLNEVNRTKNLYVRAFFDFGIDDKLKEIMSDINLFTYSEITAVYVLGEIFGPGIQDLNYGMKKPEFRVFDVVIKDADGIRFFDPKDIEWFCNRYDFEHVPFLGEVPYDLEKLVEYRDGKTTLGEGHIREGIVIRSKTDGAKKFKFVSPDYLLRKGGTEFN